MSSSPSLTDDEHDSYHPSGSPTPASQHASGSKRGRKPGAPGSRAAREALRKVNHSVIEKRRREKINETMTALRSLLADGYHPSQGVAEAEAQEQASKSTKKAQDFKLEVLERSVVYIHSLLDKIGALENQLSSRPDSVHVQPTTCANCATTATTQSDAVHRSAKRKRDAAEESSSAASASSTRLPSISSLLNPQLPSPPMTAPMRPTAQDIPPILTLPAARTHKPPPSPDSINWTPDEEHVASLLLNISSNRSASPTSPQTSRAPASHQANAVHSKRARIGKVGGGPVSMMTPAGILGLRPASG